MSDWPTYSFNPPEEFLQTSASGGEILIVDDAPEICELLSITLSEIGYTARCAMTGPAALEAATTILPDLILLDIMLPEIDGYEICRRLKSRVETQEIPVIFLSAMGQTFDRLKGFEVGGANYITKPFDLDEALARISHQMVIRQQQKQLQQQNQQLQQEIRNRQQVEANLQQTNQALQQEIHQHQQTEQALRESQQRLSAIAANIPGGFVYRALFHPDGSLSFPYISAGFEKMTGIAPDAVAAQAAKWLELIYPEDKSRYQQHVQTGIEALQPAEIEFRLILPSGTVKWVQNNSNYRQLENDNVVADGVVIDITERKQSSEALQAAYEVLASRVDRRTTQLEQVKASLSQEMQAQRQAKEELKRFFNLSLDLFCIAGVDGYFKRLNPRFEAILGYSAETLMSRPFVEFVHPEDRAATLAELEHLSLGNPTVQFENRYRCSDGTYRWLAWVAIPYEDGLIYAVARDTTESKCQAEALEMVARGVSFATGEAFFPSLVKHLAQALEVEYAFVGELVAPTQTSIRTIAFWANGQIVENTQYDLADTPCAEVVNQRLCAYPAQVQRQFPQDEFLQQLGIESYLGVPLIDTTGEVLGLMSVLGRQPHRNTRFMEEILQLFAVRAGSELERRRSEDSLRESEENFRQLAENIREVFYIQDAQSFQFLYVSPAFEQIWGIPCDRIYRTPYLWLEAIHLDDRDRIAATLSQQDPESGFPQEYRILRPNGELRWIGSRSFPVRDDSGQCYRIVGIAEDITDRKLSEEALRTLNHYLEELVEERTSALTLVNMELQQEIEERKRMARDLQQARERLDSILASIDDVVWSIEAETLQLLYINPAVETIYQRDAAEFFDNSNLWFELSHPDDREKILADQQTFLKTGRHEFEYRIFRPNGEIRWIRVSARLIYGAEGSPIRMDGLTVDITDRKQAEIALQQAKAAADAANRAKSEFLANMSHEIRTPMNAILGFCDLLKGSLTESRSQSYLDAIASSGRTLLDLIEDILDLSKLEAGRLDVHDEAVNLRQLIQEVCHIFSQKASQKNLALVVEIAPTVPAAIQFDAVRLRQILFNVVGNALKFTEQGSVTIAVRCLVEDNEPEQKTLRAKAMANETHGVVGQSDDIGMAREYADLGSPIASPLPRMQLELTVTDTGIGIATDQQERIFQPFIQSEGQSSRRYGGTGLGLAITRRLTEMLGGTVRLHSVLGEGSQFQFVFPQVAIAPQEEQSATECQLDNNLEQFQASTILAIDDIPANLELLQGYFANSKHQLLQATNGEEAIETAQTHPLDLILLDLRMPALEGQAIAQQLRQNKRTKDIPIVVFAASPQMREKTQLDELYQGFLYKPVSRHQLVAAFKKILPRAGPPETASSVMANSTSGSIAAAIEPSVPEDLPALLAILHQEEATHWQELRQTMKLRDLQDFARRLQQWGRDYCCPPLQDYATKLANQIETFDWDSLPQTIATFPMVVRSLEPLPYPLQTVESQTVESQTVESQTVESQTTDR